MKKLILSCSLLALTMPAYAAETISCDTLPTCEELGYTDTAADCSGKKLVCPFDKTKATCLESPQVGDLKYSVYYGQDPTSSGGVSSTLYAHKGWLPCDGKQYKIADYPKLYKIIGTRFCHKFTSRNDTSYTSNCKADYFAVPDYRGFYLRGATTSRPTSETVGGQSNYYSDALYYKGDHSGSYYTYTPYYEELPNIQGTFTGARQTNAGDVLNTTGAFSSRYPAGYKDSMYHGTTPDYYVNFTFAASNSNQIYNGTHVHPTHYHAYIYIYAGE